MRKRLYVLLLVLVSVGFVVPAGADFTFVVMADPQIGFVHGNADLTPEMDNFRNGIEQVNKLKPAFVIIAGDLVHHVHNTKQIRAFWQVAGLLDKSIPLRLVAGNHDVGTATPDDMKSYRRVFGQDFYSFSYGNSTFIVLNSNLIREVDADPAPRAEHRKWFEEQLAAAKERKSEHIFVIAHHPWFVEKPDEPADYHNVPPAVRREYLDLMKQYGVEYALSGHLHREASANYGGISLIATLSVGKPLGEDPIGFRVFRVSGERVTHEYVRLSPALTQP